MKNLFFPRSVITTFLGLFVGLIVLYGATLFVFNAYWQMSRKHLTGPRLANEVVRIVTIAQMLPVTDLPSALKHLRHSGLIVQLSHKPKEGLMPLYSFNLNSLRHAVLKQPRRVDITLPLGNNVWLNISNRPLHPLWLLIQFGFILLLLLFCLALLCFWVIKRLALPTEQLAHAAQTFSIDSQAAPLSETGPATTRQVIRAFNQIQARAQQLMHNRTQMLAAISHDLRTPITRLKLRLEQLPNNQQKQKLEQDLVEMEEMIHSILAFARDYAQNEPMERFDINALLQAICDDRNDMGQIVMYRGSEQRMIVFSRLNPLKRALNNLINNAIKYGQRAELSLKQVAAETNTIEHQVEIKLTDHGPGIPEHELEHVFLPFYRVDKARSSKTGGSGLGLAVTRDIIQLLGGTITLHNQQPRGLCVIIKLPLQSPPLHHSQSQSTVG